MATCYVSKLNSRSIRFRLTTWYAALLAATFICSAVLVWLTLSHSITATVDKELRARYATVRSYVEQESSGRGIAHLRKELNEDAAVSAGSAYLRIADEHGVLLFGSPRTDGWPVSIPKRRELPKAGVLQTVRPGGKAMRVLSAPAAIGTVQIGLPLDEFQEMQQGFLWTVILGAPLLLVVAAGAGYWMSGRALRPVDHIAVAAQRITSKNLSERLPYSGAGDELDRLSGVLNEMLAELESAFARVTQFTADASHELRTPLAIVRTTAELMRSRTRRPEEHDQAWTSVLAQTDRTSQLVNDLLTLARGDSGADALTLEATNLEPVARAAAAEMQVLAASKEVLLHFTTRTRPVVLADADALHRVFTILLDNALKAVAPGGVIRMSLTLKDEPESQSAVVAVEDNGPGIGPEDLPHIFDRFYRVSKDRSRETGGAGLGLAIAKWIVSRHDGMIQVESQLGQGASFSVILPLLITTESPFTNSSETESKMNA